MFENLDKSNYEEMIFMTESIEKFTLELMIVIMLI